MVTRVANSSNVRRSAPRPPAARPSVLSNLETTNRELVQQVERDVTDVAHHPWSALTGMLRNMVFPLLHPVTAVETMVAGIQEDHVGGIIDAVGSASGTAFAGAIAVAGLAVVAAPFTGGASLAVAAGAMALGTPLGYVSLGSDGAGMLLHEARGASAQAPDAARAEGAAIAPYAEDAALNLGTLVIGNAVEDRFFPGRPASEPVSNPMGDMVNNTIGLAGVYSPPPISLKAPVARLGRVAPHGDRLLLSQDPKRHSRSSPSA